jgi:hypothetical protein
MALATITIGLLVETSDPANASDAVGHMLDSGAIQDVIAEYGADRGLQLVTVRSWHDVEPGPPVADDWESSELRWRRS